jgi:5-methylcytosine-specific restriction endonuclease McrA
VNKEERLRRNLRSIDDERISLIKYISMLKTSGYTLEETLDYIKAIALEENVPNIDDQLFMVFKTFPQIHCKTMRTIRLSGSRHTEQEWEYKKQQYNNRCFYCGKKSRHLTKDHIVPLLLGGTNDIGNIVPACRLCNRKKYTKRIEFFKEGAMLKLL